jgi:hypothetical protein
VRAASGRAWAAGVTLDVTSHHASICREKRPYDGATGEDMFFDLFSPSKVDVFAQTLGHEVARRYPPAVANDPERLITLERRTTILGEIFSVAYRFNLENRLGPLRKARLGNTFRWTLRGMGYDEEFIDTATGLLLTSLAPRPGPDLESDHKPSPVE